MNTARLEVLSTSEVEMIHHASMKILAETGVRCDYPLAQRLFQDAGAVVDPQTQAVKIPESLVRWAAEQAPHSFSLFGRDDTFQMTVGGSQTQFAGLGTPVRIIDSETRETRPCNMDDVIRHIVLIDACRHIHNSQMDIWPNDIPMTTIHTEAINAWAHHSRKSFGMGCYGYLPTLDMMRMMALACGGKTELRLKPRFLGICSVLSPLQMAQMQLEGLLICAEYGQPVAISPEAIAGATAPATLAGLLAQENAAILAHITLAQIFRPGAPVLYGTVSTIANMRHGTVALGAVETGLITAASAQLARYYGLPTRSVGGATESKTEDVQAGIERTQTLLPAVMAGVNLITCGGTLDSTMLESDAMLLLDDDLCGAMLRLQRGIEVTDETLALDLIRQIGFNGNYLAEEHTVRHFRHEHYLPQYFIREPYEAWLESGSPTAVSQAYQKIRDIICHHTPVSLDQTIEQGLSEYRQMVASRPMDEFYNSESPDQQDWNHL